MTRNPLASIFGSGFLVIVPMLTGAVGKYSVAATVSKSTAQRLGMPGIAGVLALITVFAVPAS